MQTTGVPADIERRNLMTFDCSAYLRRATSRAKSDVANKLVSMFLHEISRKACAEWSLWVNDSAYSDVVANTFGIVCCYCQRPLEMDRAAVEHLDGMNRFRVGLHIPGNVLVACNRCNREKRRDDSLLQLSLAESGWESFLSHNSTRCLEGCLTCTYWRGIWPDLEQRSLSLQTQSKKIAAFRALYKGSLIWGAKAVPLLRVRLDAIYRECQEFATSRITKSVEEVMNEIRKTS